MPLDIKSQAISGMIWTGVERFGTQFIHFVTEIVIARILVPADFGIIAMLSIFMAVAQSFLDSGFANALIQKKDRTEIDYSTVFYFNILVAVLLYIILYLTAPLIAAFYNMPILTEVTRIYTLSLIFNGLTIVQTAKLSIELNFRTQAIASIISIILAGSLGIFLAYRNYGVWALVAQGVAIAGIRMLVLWFKSSWKPLLVFSYSSFRQLFSFGSKLLASGMINTIYQNLYSIVIGKFFSASSLGFFNRAEKFASLPTMSITQIVLKVNFPILSKYQDDDVKLISIYKRLLRAPIFILYPSLLGMAALANPLIEVVLGAKWLPCVPLLQILCVGYIWGPLTHINLNLLYVKGRSDLVLKLELIKKPFAFLLLFASIPLGLMWVCVGKAIYEFIAFAFNCYYTKKILNYGITEQFHDIYKIIINSVVMVGVVIVVTYFFKDPILKVCIGIMVGILVFVVLSFLSKDSTFNELLSMVTSKQSGCRFFFEGKKQED